MSKNELELAVNKKKDRRQNSLVSHYRHKINTLIRIVK